MKNSSQNENLIVFRINSKTTVYTGINATILKSLFCIENKWLKVVRLKQEEIQSDNQTITFIDVIPKLDAELN